MNILITGGTGYIGSHIISSLDKKKNKIILLDKTKNLKKLKKVPQKCIVYSDNINENSLFKIFISHEIDCVIHLASNIKQRHNSINSFKKDIENLKLIIKYLKEFNVRYFLYTSSCDVYGNQSNLKARESLKCNPISNYGKSKLKSEKIIRSSLRNSKIIYQILRIFNLIGFDKKYNNINILNRANLISNIITNYRKRKNLNIYGYKCKTFDGTCVRDYMHIKDLSLIIRLLLEKINKIKSGIVNIGSSVPMSNLEIIKSIEVLNNIKIKYSKCKKKNDESSFIVSDNSKLKKITKLSNAFFRKKLDLSSYNLFFK